MRPPPPPRKCNLQGVQGPISHREEGVVPQSPQPAPSSVVPQALPKSPEARPKRDRKLIAWGLMVAGCGLSVLVIGTLAMRQELDHEIRQLVAEYAAKKRDLTAEYQAKQRDLETKYETRNRELTTKLKAEYEALTTKLEAEYEAQKRGLMAEYAAKTQELVAEYQTKKDQNDSVEQRRRLITSNAMRQVIAEAKRTLEPSAAQFPGMQDFYRNTLKQKCAFHKDKGLCTGEPLIDEPDDYAFDKFEYDLDGSPVDEATVRDYFTLSYLGRCGVCVVSRHELLQSQRPLSIPGSSGH